MNNETQITVESLLALGKQMKPLPRVRVVESNLLLPGRVIMGPFPIVSAFPRGEDGVLFAIDPKRFAAVNNAA